MKIIYEELSIMDILDENLYFMNLYRQQMPKLFEVCIPEVNPCSFISENAVMLKPKGNYKFSSIRSIY